MAVTPVNLGVPSTPRAAIARHWLGVVAAGGDPQDAFKKAAGRPTMADLAERYRDEVSIDKAPKTRADERSAWKCHIPPAIGDKAVADVTEEDVVRIMRGLANAGKKVTANQVRKFLSHAFAKAERWGWRERGSNPTQHVERYRVRKRKRAVGMDEVARLAIALAAFEAEVPRPRTWRAAPFVRLLLLLGCRKTELLSARTGDVDLESRRLAVPANKEKDPDKVVPIPEAAVADFRRLLAEADGGWLFPSTRYPGRRMVSSDDTARRIFAAAAVPWDGFHALRHTDAAAGTARGYSLGRIAGVLGHSETSTTETYAHLIEDPRRRVADDIGGALDAVLVSDQAYS